MTATLGSYEFEKTGGEGHVAKPRQTAQLTSTERHEIFVRLRAPERFETIARDMKCSEKSIQRLMAVSGGCRRKPHVPTGFRLSEHERSQSARGLAAGACLRQIATSIGRAPSTVSREVSAAGDRQRYETLSAQRRAVRFARRPKPRKLEIHTNLQDTVEASLAEAWRPQ